MTPLLWALTILLVGFVLTIAEVFIPSGGILGFLAASAVITSIVMAFVQEGVLVGALFAMASVVMVPILVAVGFKYWPHTPIGRRILLGLPTEEEVLPENDLRAHSRKFIGRIGQAKTKMLPAGAIQIDGRLLDAMSEGAAIESGQYVKVIEVRANRIVVRVVADEEAASQADPRDLLAQPIERLGLGSFEEPLS